MSKRILLIDHDPLVSKSVGKLLAQQGYEVKTAGSAIEALTLAAQFEFDLIISDIRMPGKNGVEAIREIRKLFDKHFKKDIPIIFITGYAEASDELNAEELGEVILKPFDLDYLLITIREYL